MTTVVKLPRGSRLLSQAASIKLVQSVKVFVGASRRGTETFARILGCSKRTARRLLHPKGLEQFPRLRRCYAIQAARVSGIPVETLCGRADAQPASPRLEAWRPEDSDLEARRKAVTLAAQLSARASFGYDLLCNFAVSHGIAGRPSSVVLELSYGNSFKHRLTLADFDGRGQVGMEYGTDRDGAVLRHHSVDSKIVHKIFRNVRKTKI